jgi:integrase
MATFKIEISNKRKDDTYNLRIRVTHNRELRRISTNMYIIGEDLTVSGKIKNQNILDLCEDILRKCRAAVMDRFTDDIDEIVDAAKRSIKGEERFKLNFIDYINTVAEKKSGRTAVNYKSAGEALRKFIQPRTDLDVSEIRVKFLKSYEAHLREKVSDGTVTAYINIVRAAHNTAKNEFNDPDTGDIKIPYSPFESYRVPDAPLTKKRAISIEFLQKIIDEKPKMKSKQFIKELFILSFALIGMNAIDLYTAKPAEKGVLVYNRSKTKKKRKDKAEMRVKLHPCIDALVEKYRDPMGERMFKFWRMYKTESSFNNAISTYMRDTFGINFYAARHTWATLARSAAVGIDKYTVHEALNHVDSAMKVTDIYIDKDWSVIWNANEKVLSLFDWSAVGYDVL